MTRRSAALPVGLPLAVAAPMRKPTTSFAIITGLCGLLAACVVDDDTPIDQIDQAICNDTEENPCDDPEGGTREPRPEKPRVVGRDFDKTDGHELTVQFTVDDDWTSYRLEKRRTGASWGFATSGTPTVDETRTYKDSGKGHDERWCYRLQATNAAGTAISNEACGLTETPDDRVPNPRVHRLQLLVKVAGFSDAGTENMITAHLSTMTVPGVHFNALNPAPRLEGDDWIDSFASGREFTYELELRQVQRVRDISEIRIHNSGDDALCIERLELLVNDTPAFEKFFGPTPSTAACIETQYGSSHGPTLLVAFDELRASPDFTSFVSPELDLNTGIIRRDEIERRVEAVVGNFIWADERVWWGDFHGDRAVEASFVDPQTLHFDLDLQGDGFFSNFEIDLDLDVRVGIGVTEGGFGLAFDVIDVETSAAYPFWSEVIGYSLGIVVGTGVYDVEWLIERLVEDAIESGFTVEGTPVSIGGVCVTEDAELVFGCTP
jgi:hypothetical protein